MLVSHGRLNLSKQKGGQEPSSAHLLGVCSWTDSCSPFAIVQLVAKAQQAVGGPRSALPSRPRQAGLQLAAGRDDEGASSKAMPIERDAQGISTVGAALCRCGGARAARPPPEHRFASQHLQVSRRQEEAELSAEQSKLNAWMRTKGGSEEMRPRGACGGAPRPSASRRTSLLNLRASPAT